MPETAIVPDQPSRTSGAVQLLRQLNRPVGGWIRAVRDALGLSGVQLAGRLGVSKQRVSVLEKAEIDGGVSLGSLRLAAEALDCDLLYALLPRSDETAKRLLEATLSEAGLDEAERIRSPLILNAIAELCRRYHIKSLGLFGSAARRELGAESDIDLLAEFEPGNAPSLSGLIQMREELTRLFGRNIDLATSSILQNPFRRRAIMRELENLYAA